MWLVALAVILLLLAVILLLLFATHSALEHMSPNVRAVCFIGLTVVCGYNVAREPAMLVCYVVPLILWFTAIVDMVRVHLGVIE